MRYKLLLAITLFAAPTFARPQRRAQASQEPPPNVRREIERITGKKNETLDRWKRAAEYKGQTWEYRVASRGYITQLGELLNKCVSGDSLCLLQAGLTSMGASGWELVAIDPTTAYVFKRRKLGR